jgi:RNA polymerase sigma-70 factor (ECF subfamily)
MDLYEQMNAPLLAYLRSLGLFDNDAGDVIQESFLRLLNHLMAGRPDDNLRAWIFQVAYSQAMDVHRFDTRFSSLGDEGDDARARHNEVADYLPSPEEVLIAREKIQRVRVALKYLPAQQRQCLLLRSEGLRYREIAHNLGVSTQRVATLMGRGVSRLVAIL